MKVFLKVCKFESTFIASCDYLTVILHLKVFSLSQILNNLDSNEHPNYFMNSSIISTNQNAQVPASQIESVLRERRSIPANSNTTVLKADKMVHSRAAGLPHQKLSTDSNIIKPVILESIDETLKKKVGRNFTYFTNIGKQAYKCRYA